MGKHGKTWKNMGKHGFIVEKTWKNKALQGLTYLDEWEFQDPKLEVPIPYIFGLFFRPKFQGISQQNMVLYPKCSMVLEYIPTFEPFLG